MRPQPLMAIRSVMGKRGGRKAGGAEADGRGAYHGPLSGLAFAGDLGTTSTGWSDMAPCLTALHLCYSRRIGRALCVRG